MNIEHHWYHRSSPGLLPNSFESLLFAERWSTIECDVLVGKGWLLYMIHPNDLHFNQIINFGIYKIVPIYNEKNLIDLQIYKDWKIHQQSLSLSDKKTYIIEQFDLHQFENKTSKDNNTRSTLFTELNQNLDDQNHLPKHQPLFNEYLQLAYDKEIKCIFEIKGSSTEKAKLVVKHILKLLNSYDRNESNTYHNPSIWYINNDISFMSFSIEALKVLNKWLQDLHLKCNTILSTPSNAEFAHNSNIEKEHLTSGIEDADREKIVIENTIKSGANYICSHWTNIYNQQTYMLNEWFIEKVKRENLWIILWPVKDNKIYNKITRLLDLKDVKYTILTEWLFIE